MVFIIIYVVMNMLGLALLIFGSKEDEKQVSWGSLPENAIHSIVMKDHKRRVDAKASRFNTMKALVPSILTSPLKVSTTWEWGEGPNMFEESNIKFWVDHGYDDVLDHEYIIVSLVDDIREDLPDLQRIQYSKHNNNIFLSDVRFPLDLHSYRVMSAALAMLIHKNMPDINPNSIQFYNENDAKGLWSEELKWLFPVSV